MQKKMISAALFLPILCVAAFAAAPKEKVQPVIERKAEFFEAPDVRITGSPFKEAIERNKKYLLSLNVDRLLHGYRRIAGLPSTAKPLGGWESLNNGLRGSFAGHYISACARMYAATGDKEMKDRVDQMVAGMAECQAKSPTGYLAEFPEAAFNDLEQKGKPGNGVWVPWWSQHGLYTGFIDAYVYAGNEQALEVAKKAGDWVKGRFDKLSEAQVQKMLGVEHGGMNEFMANLYVLTGNKDYLTVAERFYHKAVLEPLAAGRDELTNKHANTQVPKLVGAARLYELTGKENYKKMASYFWHEVVEKRSYVMGGNSIEEHFKKLGTEPLGPRTAETCNTHNMLRLTRHLMEWEPTNTEYADYYERALLNHILASQDTETGMMLYFASTKPGHFKVYNTPESSFWCCTGTGVENPPRYGEAVYSHAKNTLWVNLFMPSELDWKDQGVRVRQDTKFPEESQTKLTIQESKGDAFTMNIRIPSWVAGTMVAKVNGKEEFKGEKNGWIAINRKWKKGDVVEVSLPMNLHLYRACDNKNNVAIMYGPVVLAGALGAEKMPPSEQPKDQNDLERWPIPITVPMLVADGDKLDSWIKPVAGKPLAFRTQGAGHPQDVDLIPFYALNHQRYSIYWSLMTTEEWAAKEQALRAKETEQKTSDAQTIDAIEVGQQQPDADHNVQNENSKTGVFNDASWRDAENGGWFSYDLKVQPDQAMQLRCTYWGDDAGSREFDILVDGKKIGEQKLEKNKPGQFFDVDYPVPAELTKGKTKITVKFQAHANCIAGGLFKLCVLKADK